MRLNSKKTTDFKFDHPDGVIVTMDQMSVYLQSDSTYVWSPIGQTPTIAISPQRDSLKIYGALDVERGYEMALVLPEMNAEATVHFLEHLLVCLPNRHILILWDRASWHKGAARRFVEAHDRLDMMYYPTACPDLNPQEHVWKLTRQAVGHARDYLNLSDLRQAFQNHLEQTLFKFDWLDKFFPPQLPESVFI